MKDRQLRKHLQFRKHPISPLGFTSRFDEDIHDIEEKLCLLFEYLGLTYKTFPTEVLPRVEKKVIKKIKE